MATYNGARFLCEQVDSILSQLSDEDELVISDDSSTDDTVSILESYKDKRIKIFSSDAHSPTYNFENAIKHASGDYIFLSDQDDVWIEGRVEEAIKVHIEKDAGLVLVNGVLVDEKLNTKRESYFRGNPIKPTFWGNLHHNPFQGSCMSFSKELLPYLIPFPKGLIMHDSWIGLVAFRHSKCEYISKPLMKYRRYGVNFTATHKYNTWTKISYRFRLVRHIFFD
jgi:glycosyltransferase involved in cell wall biosynthesis